MWGPLFFPPHPLGGLQNVSTVQVFVGSSRRVWMMAFCCGRVPLKHPREKWVKWIGAPASTIVWFGNLWTAQAYLGFRIPILQEKCWLIFYNGACCHFLVPCSYTSNYRAYVRLKYVRDSDENTGPFFIFSSAPRRTKRYPFIVRLELLLQKVGVSSKDHATLGQLSADDTSYSGEDGKEE